MHLLGPWILALLAACTPETDPGAPGGPSTPPSGPTGETGEGPGDDTSMPAVDPTGSAVISTRPDLATWLGFDITLDHTTVATLACDSDSEPEERHARVVGSGFTSLPGVLADHTYTCRLLVEVRGEEAPFELWSEQTTTPPLPGGLPELVFTVGTGSEIEGGWLVFSQWDQGPTQRALIVDGRGRYRWHAAVGGTTPGTNVAWAPPYLVAGGGQSLPPTQLTLDGDEVFRGPELDEPLFYHHEARGVDVDGTAGILTLATTILDKANATYSTAQAGFRAEVHDPATGELLWTWDVSDHLDDWGPPAPKVDPWHANAMTWEGDGHSWISARGTNHVTRIDRTTGRATHVLGADGTVTLLDADGNERPSDDWFSGQHGPAQHGDRLFLLDNGRTRRGFSRAVEYRLDLVASTATEAWTWTEDGWFEPYYGNVDLLPGGHVLVASGHCNRCDGTGGPERRAFAAEIDQATNEVLWRMDFVDPGASLFRAQYVAPCDLFHHVGRCTE